MSKYKKDYLALQIIWQKCANKYIDSTSNIERMRIIDDFLDSIIDIKKDDDTRSIRSIYEKWEQTYWIPFCKTKLVEWIKHNPFESRIENNKIQELQNIKQDYNYMRYRKIMQLIQDSGIGLGQTGEGGGYYVGPSDIDRFTK